MTETSPSPRTPQPISIGGGWTLVLAIAALAAFGVAGWAYFAQRAPLTDRLVFVPLLAGLWFTARIALKFWSRP